VLAYSRDRQMSLFKHENYSSNHTQNWYDILNAKETGFLVRVLGVISADLKRFRSGFS
jgi:hypothetical protein